MLDTFTTTARKMIMKTTLKKCPVAVSLALVSAVISSQACASGFALIENSASGMGNAFAGAAAIAEDASTIWFNPAGMTKLSGSRISVAGHIIAPKAEFTNDSSTLVTTAALTGSNQDAGVTKFVPNFYYITQINNDVTFGLGINAPFGLETDYNDDSWIGRYHATHSAMTTINVNPALAFKASDKLSIGVGLNYQYIEVTLENQLDPGAVCLGLRTRILQENNITAGTNCFLDGLTAQDTDEGSQSLSGDDISWGINFGILYDFSSVTRIGVAYRSGVNHDLAGNVDFEFESNDLGNFITTDLPAPYATLLQDAGITAHTELPDTLSISFIHNLNTALSVLADATLTRWSSFNELKIQFDNADTVQPDSVTPENWNNTWRFSLGANYKVSDTMTCRFGVALDQSPVDLAEDRTARIPDNDRTWLSLGLGYALNSDMSVDVGYSHLFVDDAAIDNTDVASGHTLNGDYDSAVDILSAQFNMKF